MGLRRSIAIGAIAIAALAAIFVYASRGQIWQSRVIEGTFDPEFVVPASGQEDPHDVGVGFRWPERGFCLGEFRVNIAETATEVRVGQVVRHVSAAGNCAGVGTNGRSAIVHETLKSAIGSRLVVRASDGLPLPVYALDAVLDCNTAVAARGAPSDGWSTVLSQVALETGITLQANPSGESDPHAALFAKSALMIAAGAEVTLSVPDDWVGRLTIGWGGPAPRALNFHVPKCPAPVAPSQWLVFPGGFWVDTPACVPVVVRRGTAQETVHLAVGAACAEGYVQYGSALPGNVRVGWISYRRMPAFTAGSWE
jgi:hypothetical protein